MSLDADAAATRRRRPRRRSSALEPLRARRGDLRRHQREDGAGDPDADRRAGDRAARLRARRVRRRRPDARRLPRRGARDRRGHRAPLPRRVLGLGDARDRSPPGLPAARSTQGRCRRDLTTLAKIFGSLEAEGRAALADEGVPPEATSVEHALDMRYEAQEYTLTITRPATRSQTASSSRSPSGFHEAHQRASATRTPARRSSSSPRAQRSSASWVEPLPSSSSRRRRRLTLADARPSSGAGAATPSWSRGTSSRKTLSGPAIVDEQTATTVVPPGCDAARRRARHAAAHERRRGGLMAATSRRPDHDRDHPQRVQLGRGRDERDAVPLGLHAGSSTR